MLAFFRGSFRRDILPLGFLLAAAFLLRVHQAVDWVVRQMGPVCFFDELWYRRNAESLFTGSSYFTFHYPPLYPLMLAPSFFSESNWYFWMLVINALLASLLLVPVWFLARRFLPPRPSMLATGLAAFLPYLWVYPRMIMSENLFGPLLTTSVYLLLTLRRRQWSRSFVFGLVLAGSLAIRHIAAPVLVFFLGWWWWKTQRRVLPRWNSLPTLVGTSAGLAVILTPWLLYGFYWGVSPLQTWLGWNITRDVTSHPDPEMLPFWVGAYLAYLLIALAPWLPWILLRFAPGGHACRSERHLAFLLAGSVLAITAASVHHSWTVLYNYPEPQRILGRYLVPLQPAILCLGMVAVYRLCSGSFVRFRTILVCAAASLGLLYLARGFLIPGGFLDLPGYFADSFINTPDSLPLATRDPWATWIFFTFPLVPLLLLPARNGRPVRAGVLAVMGLLVFSGYWISGGKAAQKLEEGGRVGVFANKVVEVCQALGADRNTVVAVVTDLPLFVRDPNRLQRPLLFFGLSDHTVVTSEVDCRVVTSDLIVYLFSKDKQEVLHGQQPVAYDLDGLEFAISGEVNPEPSRQPCILDFGPRYTWVGRKFNPDAAGRSSMWLRGRNLTKSVWVELDGQRIKPRRASSDVITFNVPDEVIASPGEKPLRVFDEQTGACSNLTQFVVRP